MRPFGLNFKPPVGHSADLTRVLRIPKRPVPNENQSEALIEVMSSRFSRKNPRCNCRTKHNRNCITRLRRAQAWALYEMGLAGGLVGSIGVGHGKTLLGLLAPLALGLRAGEIAVLLCPPSNVGEIIGEYQLAGQHFHLSSITVHGSKNFTMVVAGTPSLHVMPYSMLSRPESTAWISQVGPKAIIADECDKLRNPQTATTSRVLRQFASDHTTKLCAWTGSLMDKSIEDFSHLSALALRDRSPLPLDPIIVKDWARAVDADEYQAPGGALMALCEPGESLEVAFSRRVRETLGFITTTEAAISAPIVITERAAPDVPANVQAALDELRACMVRPDGEELIDALAVAKCASELACGFYYKWIFPRGEPEALIERWFTARKAWNKELREFLIPRHEGLDSEKLARDAAKRFHRDLTTPGPEWESHAWPAWCEVEPLVQPKSKAVRLNDYLAQDCAEWGLQNTGIIWYTHREFGKWVAELSGLPLHTGGPKARELILEETGNRSIVASIKSHGRGRDGLQFAFSNQLITTMPSSSRQAEQLLGRLHRTGQESGLVRAEYYAHTPELAAAFHAARRKAAGVQTILSQEQKLLK